MSLKDSFIKPDWPAPTNVCAVVTTRLGGNSAAPYDSFNLAFHVGDEPSHVVENRRKLLVALNEIAPCGPPQWLQQVHGTEVIDAFSEPKRRAQTVPEGDAVFTIQRGLPCVVMTADCLPVFFCDQSGYRVAVAHAGWRGLANGILENTLAKFTNPAEVMCWLGPAIGPTAFEVGAEVRELFVRNNAMADSAFIPQGNGKYLADIYSLARQRLMKAGIGMISGGHLCTVTEQEKFFSYRREHTTGRMASIIWLS